MPDYFIPLRDGCYKLVYYLEFFDFQRSVTPSRHLGSGDPVCNLLCIRFIY